MNLKIHRGTHEIGGSCIELNSAYTRLIFDLGLPLVDKAGNGFDFKQYRNCSATELIALNILPDIKGLYKHEPAEISAVIISHPHQDHYGLLQYIHDDIPVYLSAGTESLIKLTGFFAGIPFEHKNVLIIKDKTCYSVGGFRIKSYLVDHSGFDSMAFEIEAENKKIFYTGDFRTHGRKALVVENIIKNPPKNIDYLLIEGTLIGGSKRQDKTEADVETELCKLFKASEKLKLISFSSQNIDRLVSVYRACIKSKHTLVIDPYTAKILDNLKPVSPNIPQFDWNNIRVFFTPNSYTEKLAQSDELWKYKNAKITIEEIEANPSKLVFKNNYRNTRIFASRGLLKNAELIYSLWEGYYEKEKEFWDAHNMRVTHIHTSGHAFVDDLKRFADALNPKFIIPIHTFAPDIFKDIFTQPIVQLDDGIELIIK